MPNKNRNKGHSFERKIAQLFRSLGWNCTTSRYSSKELDDQKIDLCGTDPFVVQAKAVERLGTLHSVLAEMPEEKGKYNVVFHKLNRKGTIVAMAQDDFIELLEMLIGNGIIKPGKIS